MSRNQLIASIALIFAGVMIGLYGWWFDYSDWIIQACIGATIAFLGLRFRRTAFGLLGLYVVLVLAFTISYTDRPYFSPGTPIGQVEARLGQPARTVQAQDLPKVTNWYYATPNPRRFARAESVLLYEMQGYALYVFEAHGKVIAVEYGGT